MKSLEDKFDDEVWVGTPTGEDDYGAPTGYEPTRHLDSVRIKSITHILDEGEDGVSTQTQDIIYSFEAIEEDDLIFFAEGDTDDTSKAKRAESVDTTDSLISDRTLYVVTLG